MSGISLSSLKFYKSDIANFLGFVKDVDNISPETVKEYTSLSLSNSSKATTNRRLSTLRRFSKFLIALNMRTSDFMNEVQSLPDNQKQALSKIEKFDRYLLTQKVSKNTRKMYLSDTNKFLLWQERTEGGVKEFLNEHQLGLSKAAYLRLLSSLKKYYEYKGAKFPKKLALPKNAPYAVLQSWILSKLDQKERLQKQTHKIFFSRPNWYKRYHTYPIANYLHLAILFIFCAVSGYAVYDQVFKNPGTSLAYPATAVSPNRYLSFQGRLTDNLSNPITTSTNLVFKLYDASTAGTTLWDSGTCAITPDSDGIFSTLFGSSCGGAIASSVFSENSDVWVGVTVGADAEATPRIQIATVAYALNSETLQGFPTGTGASTIPYIDSSGNVVIAAASPTLQSTSGTFAVEGVALTLTTPNTTNGIITINPDGTGTLNLTFEGAAAGASANGFVNATNANITSGALYGGTVASAADGYNFLDFQAGISPASVFSVNALGNTTMAGDLTITGDDLFMNTNTANYFLMADGTNYNPVTPAQAVTGLGLGAGGSSDIWVEKGGDTMTGNLILNDSVALALGTSSDFTIAHGGTNTVFDNTFATGNTQMQLGTDTTATAFQILNNTGTPLFEVEGGGNVGIGTTGPSAPLHVIGDVYISDGLSLYATAVSDGTVEATQFCTG
ncbi:site-specific integrase, partial [Candidatus Microgenomates bacterium]|nr:site-specific integrase [Candidatus Microgenomates bacterium]